MFYHSFLFFLLFPPFLFLFSSPRSNSSLFFNLDKNPPPQQGYGQNKYPCITHNFCSACVHEGRDKHRPGLAGGSSSALLRETKTRPPHLLERLETGCFERSILVGCEEQRGDITWRTSVHRSCSTVEKEPSLLPDTCCWTVHNHLLAWFGLVLFNPTDTCENSFRVDNIMHLFSSWIPPNLTTLRWV